MRGDCMGAADPGKAFAHIVEQRLEPYRLVADVPQSQVVARRREQIPPVALVIWHPHDLCRRVGVLEAAAVDELVRLLVELDDAHRVVVLLLEGADRQPEPLIGTHTPVHPIDEPRCRVCVDLFALGAGPLIGHDALACSAKKNSARASDRSHSAARGIGAHLEPARQVARYSPSGTPRAKLPAHAAASGRRARRTGRRPTPPRAG